jgi:superfamily II DNA or RNA helicase
LLGRESAVVTIHGGMGREARMHAQERFRHDPEVQVLVATDAAGEGINLQRAHLMVNYDLPWNPNRLEQRFGRIHRIGQTEVCHLWNLIAEETREADVYRVLLSSTFALFELGKGGFSWCHSLRRSVTQPPATMQGTGYEGPRLCCSSTEDVAADFCQPNVSSVPRPDARSHLDDWPPDHHHHLMDCAP